MDKVALNCLVAHRLPWLVIKILADDTCVSLSDIADRWESKQSCRNSAEPLLKLKLTCKYDDAQSDRACQRLASGI